MKLLIALVALFPLGASAITADELVAKNLAARGGADKLRAITTLHSTGKTRFDGGGGVVEAQAETWARAPGQIRFAITVQGFENLYAYDGKTGWKVEPGGGRRDAERLSPDDSKTFVEEALFTGFLLDYKARGHKLEYLGTDDVDGTDAHKLKVTLRNGDFVYVFLDPDHFLEIRKETHRWVRGAEQVEEVDFGEYENVNGTFWPFYSTNGLKGSPSRVVSITEKLELGAPVDEALFRMPDLPVKK